MLPPHILRMLANNTFGGTALRSGLPADWTPERIRARHREEFLWAATTAGVAANFRTLDAGTILAESPLAARDRRRLRQALAIKGLMAQAAAPTHLPEGAARGWRVADAGFARHRRELADALGVLVLEGTDGGAPEPAAAPAPIDVVYTWVDGSDREWRAERAAAQAEATGTPLATSDDEARYASRDELRYSLRSLEYFAPWINHIYIVTADQVPGWLDTDGGRVSVVPHRDIFADPGNLPTFNSHAIESQLHHIEGLSERFIYMNDDVFFGRPVDPELFYAADGSSRYFLSKQRIGAEKPGDLPVNVAARNNRAVLQRRFGRSSIFKFLHVAHAQLRTTLEAIEADERDEVERTAAARFRSDTDLSIPSSLAHYYGTALGRAVPGEVGYNYIDLSDATARLRLLRLMWTERPQMFCLNEVASGGRREQETLKMMQHFLQEYFPFPSAFERPEVPRGTVAAGRPAAARN
ncbi:hypothetical protein GCM10023081_05760 [Arthrobacter ginkgonis]|uniref:Sugar phosphotransferase n=1 Tax=Arthrobacter ginkgonis TaxID=1630594 RepID=A0ABP7BWZ7_9MICC